MGANGGWTFGTLLTHVMALFEMERHHARDLREADDVRYEQRFKSSQSALEQASRELSSYKASQNEWRATMADRDKAYISRPEHDALAEKVAACLTRSEVLALVATIVGVVGILIEVLNFAMFQHK